MLALIEELKVAEREGDKTIVYSQCKFFLQNMGLYPAPKEPNANICSDLGTSVLNLIETLFGRYGIQSLRYDGKMSREAREKTLVQFKQIGGPKVILIRYIQHSALGVVWADCTHLWRWRILASNAAV